MAKQKLVTTIEELYSYFRKREFENYKKSIPGKSDTMICVGKAEAYRNAAEKAFELMQKLREQTQVKP